MNPVPPDRRRQDRRRQDRRRGAVAVIERDGRLLVIRRSRFVAAPLRYCFPGGGIEPGETEQQALCRELREELAVVVEPLERIWRCVTPWNVDLAWWAAHLPLDAQPVPHPAEVDSVHWFTPAELGSLDGLLESNQEFLRHWRANREGSR